MATRVFADGDLARLREFPEISREELFRYFTLSPADAAFIDPGRGRGPADRLGIAIALCTLPWLGFGPDRVVTAPPVAVARLAEQLKVHPTESGDPARPGESPTPVRRPSARPTTVWPTSSLRPAASSWTRCWSPMCRWGSRRRGGPAASEIDRGAEHNDRAAGEH